MDGITKEYGGLTALSDVTFRVPVGRIVGLIGPNGAGKTTLVDVIAGLSRPSKGHIYINETDIAGWAPHRIAALGIARTYQQVRLVPDMSVLDNLILGHHSRQKNGFFGAILSGRRERDDERDGRDEALRLLELIGLPHYANRLGSELSFGEQRRIEIARALAMDPSLLLMDEPTAGVTSSEIGRLLDIIGNIRKRERTILLIEHNMRVVREICDEVVVLNLGTVIAQGPPDEVLSDPTVIKVYLSQGHA